MSNKRSIEILSTLAQGIDPTSGEVFPEDSPYQNVEVVRALNDGVTALQRTEKADNRKKSAPAQAGRPWTAEEDKTLLESYSAGKTVKDLVKLHARSDRAIISRLARLGGIRLSAERR